MVYLSIYLGVCFITILQFSASDFVHVSLVNTYIFNFLWSFGGAMVNVFNFVSPCSFLALEIYLIYMCVDFVSCDLSEFISSRSFCVDNLGLCM